MRERAVIVATKVAIQMTLTGRFPIGRVSLSAVINLCMGDLIRELRYWY